MWIELAFTIKIHALIAFILILYCNQYVNMKWCSACMAWKLLLVCWVLGKSNCALGDNNWFVRIGCEEVFHCQLCIILIHKSLNLGLCTWANSIASNNMIGLTESNSCFRVDTKKLTKVNLERFGILYASLSKVIWSSKMESYWMNLNKFLFKSSYVDIPKWFCNNCINPFRFDVGLLISPIGTKLQLHLQNERKQFNDT